MHEAIDPAPLEKLIMATASRFAIGGTPASAQVCETLQQAADQPLFFEALITFGMQAIPFGDGYPKWRKKTKRRMSKGYEIYFLGCRERYPAEYDRR